MAKGKQDQDKRIEAVRTLVQSGSITSLKGIFEIMPMTAVAAGANLHYSTLHKKIYSPGLIRTDEYILLADFFGLAPTDILGLALRDMNYKPKTK